MNLERRFSRTGAGESRLFSLFDSSSRPPIVRKYSRLMAFGNRDPAFYYSDFDIRLPGLAPRKACHSPSGTPWVVLKAKRAVRELPDGALIEKCLVVPLAPESHCHF